MSDVPVVKYYEDSAAIQAKHKWWAEKPENLYNSVFGIVNRITQNQTYRAQDNLRHARLYANKELVGLQNGLFSQVRPSSSSQNNRITLNVIRSCIDTVTSKIGKMKPRPLFLTINGNWTQQKRSKLLTHYMDGWFYDSKVYEHGRMAFRDGTIFGTGVVKLYRTAEEVKCERVLIEELLVDDVEGMYGEPRQLHQRKFVPRSVLLDMYPKAEFEILSATSSIDAQTQSQSIADMIEVIESWHLPSGKGAGDGRHSICIENKTLFEEKWTKDYFPFVFFRWSPRVVGFYGAGLAEELVGIQIEINKLLMNIQAGMHLVAVPQVWLEMQNKVNQAQMDNKIGGIKYFSGQPPIFMSPNAFPAEVYSHLENLYRKAFEISGVSMLSAASHKPSGIDSAVAMREYQDIESERFMTVGMNLEEFYMRIADIAYDLHEDLYEDDVNVVIKASDKRSFQELKWSDVRIKRDSFTMRVFPTSILPTSPAGKLQKTQELVQAGFIDKETAMSLLDFPDIERYSSLANAAVDDVLMIIEKLLDGEPMTPEPYMNLALAKRMVQSAYLRAKNDGAPPEILDLLQSFMDECQAMIDQAVLASQPPPPEALPPEQMPLDPLAQPEALPTSDLLPVA
jgi:hypothetical protein